MNWKRTLSASAALGALAVAASTGLSACGVEVPIQVAAWATAGGFGSLAILHVIAVVIGPEKTQLDEVATRIEDTVIDAASELGARK